MISKSTLNSGFVALCLSNKLRDCDILTNFEGVVDLVLETFDWVDFAVKEEEIFRLVFHGTEIEANPMFLGNSVIISVELGLAEPGRIHPDPLPIPSTSSEPIKGTFGLVSFRIEGT